MSTTPEENAPATQPAAATTIASATQPAAATPKNDALAMREAARLEKESQAAISRKARGQVFAFVLSIIALVAAFVGYIVTRDYASLCPLVVPVLTLVATMMDLVTKPR